MGYMLWGKTIWNRIFQKIKQNHLNYNNINVTVISVVIVNKHDNKFSKTAYNL